MKHSSLWGDLASLGLLTLMMSTSLACGVSPEDLAGSARRAPLAKPPSKTVEQAAKPAPVVTKEALKSAEVVAATRSVGDLRAVRVPVFKDTIKPGERKELVARLDQALADMKKESKVLPSKIQEGVKVWESLEPLQREQMLSGQFGATAAVPTWAVAAVGAAALVYEVGKDYNWWGSARDKFNSVAMKASDLDYIEAKLGVPSPVLLDRALTVDAVRNAGPLKGAKVPVFKDTVKPEEQLQLVARLDQALADMKREAGTLPPKIQDGVKIWESLSTHQRQELLGGGYGSTAAIPTWAVAAVGAAALVYDVGKDYNWWGSARDKFNSVTMKAVDLDYIEGFVKAPAAMTRAEHVAVVQSLGDLKETTQPVFKDSVKPAERKKLVARLDKAFADMKKEAGALPPRIQDGVRVWESLNQSQRAKLLAGNYDGTAAVPTWAVAAVGAAALVYEVGKDYNWWGASRDKLDVKAISPTDLDYVEHFPR